jgi:hypothetical protein
MNQPPESQSTPEQTMNQPCPCRELVNTVCEFLAISAAARQHLANSRVEFLKALRAMLDARIEHLSNQPHKGTKLAVE